RLTDSLHDSWGDFYRQMKRSTTESIPKTFSEKPAIWEFLFEELGPLFSAFGCGEFCCGASGMRWAASAAGVDSTERAATGHGLQLPRPGCPVFHGLECPEFRS